jgi:hypothetical protein
MKLPLQLMREIAKNRVVDAAYELLEGMCCFRWRCIHALQVHVQHTPAGALQARISLTHIHTAQGVVELDHDLQEQNIQ